MFRGSLRSQCGSRIGFTADISECIFVVNLRGYFFRGITQLCNPLGLLAEQEVHAWQRNLTRALWNKIDNALFDLMT